MKNNESCLIQYTGLERVKCKTEEDYQKLIDGLNKINSLKESQYIFGNVKKTYSMFDKRIIAVFDVYYKLSDIDTLENIDKQTIQLNNESELSPNDNYSSPKIGRFASKTYEEFDGKTGVYDIGIHTEEILYKNEKNLLNDETLNDIFNYFSNNMNFYFFINLTDFDEYSNLIDINLDFSVPDINEFFKGLSEYAKIFYNNCISKENSYVNKRRIISFIKNFCKNEKINLNSILDNQIKKILK